MPTIGKHSAMHLDTILATDFSPASYNAGLYASALSTHFHTNLIVVHACTLTQAALDLEAEKPLTSLQRYNLNHDLKLTAENLDAGGGITETILLEGDPYQVAA